MAVTVRYFAGARAAAGIPEEDVAAADVSELREQLTSRHGAEFGKILGVSTILVDGRAARDAAVALGEGTTVEVLPPFAGG